MDKYETIEIDMGLSTKLMLATNNLTKTYSAITPIANFFSTLNENTLTFKYVDYTLGKTYLELYCTEKNMDVKPLSSSNVEDLLLFVSTIVDKTLSEPSRDLFYANTSNINSVYDIYCMYGESIINEEIINVLSALIDSGNHDTDTSTNFLDNELDCKFYELYGDFLSDENKIAYMESVDFNVNCNDNADIDNDIDSVYNDMQADFNRNQSTNIKDRK